MWCQRVVCLFVPLQDPWFTVDCGLGAGLKTCQVLFPLAVDLPHRRGWGFKKCLIALRDVKIESLTYVLQRQCYSVMWCLGRLKDYLRQAFPEVLGGASLIFWLVIFNQGEWFFFNRCLWRYVLVRGVGPPWSNFTRFKICTSISCDIYIAVDLCHCICNCVNSVAHANKPQSNQIVWP